MIGFILLIIASASLVAPGCAQDYDYEEVRPSRATYRGNTNNEAVSSKPAATVVPILKQIDRHNDDGSYTYGFESADGSFKIETKQANGEVKGKYGYTDANGKLHIVEYGANKFGFQPSGEGIDVPPVNFNPEPEEQEEELPRRVQPKLQPRPKPAIQQIQPWEQNIPAPAPQPQHQPQPVRSQLRTQVVVPQSRPKPAEPHIIYNSPAPSPTPKRPAFFSGAQPAPAPAPKRPSFFAGAQPASEPAQAINYDYEEQAIPQRPPKPVRAQTLAITKAQQPSYFVPSSEFRQETQYSQISSKSVRPSQFDDNSQYYSPEPPKQQFRGFAEPAPAPAPRAYTAPKVTKSKSGGGFLDQLEEQYSLPSGGQPTHNIAFGFY